MKKIIVILTTLALLTLFTGCKCNNSTTDVISPVITIIGDNPQIIEIGTPYVEFGATANDETDGSLPVSIDASSVDTQVAGTYSVTYTATDLAGHITTVIRTVIVVYVENPGIEIFLSTLTAIPDGNGGFLTFEEVISQNGLTLNRGAGFPDIQGNYDVKDFSGGIIGMFLFNAIINNSRPEGLIDLSFIGLIDCLDSYISGAENKFTVYFKRSFGGVVIDRIVAISGGVESSSGNLIVEMLDAPLDNTTGPESKFEYIAIPIP